MVWLTRFTHVLFGISVKKDKKCPSLQCSGKAHAPRDDFEPLFSD